MDKMSVIGLGLLVALASACGPSVSVTRMKSAPARPATCELQFVDVDLAQINTEKEWSILGYVTLQETGIADPYSERYRKIVRPRACKMGGEAVAIGVSSSNQSTMGAGSGTSYVVLTPYSEKEESEPTQF